MSKPKVTPAPPGPQEEPAPRTIPLSEITITWPPLGDFEGEPAKPITLSGKQLGLVLAWMARKSNVDDPCYREGVQFDLRGLAEILRGLGAADLEMIPVNTSAIFPLLATMATDLAARLSAADDVETDLPRATVTIGAPATGAG